ncbi:histidine kinase dimerization/phospho-acceptor domain-containing protein [Streptomyces sp. NPDC087420]|uniref:histidine kinase dimerization/phospho-acceptor domain-containing protein n=1 Tax=Streptomyces sp. NPDC087420 TaxID=3365785 RepID=UPI003836D914
MPPRTRRSPWQQGPGGGGRRAAARQRRDRHAGTASGHRPPVANIRGHAELALRHHGPLPTEVSHALNRIDAESRRMTRLADDLLLLTSAPGHPTLHVRFPAP